MWVTLTEAGMRRRDAPKLLAVLQALGVDQPRFVRESRYIRIVRHAQHDYKRVEMAWTTKRGGYYWYPLQPLFNRTITERDYKALPGDIKPYFNRYVERSRWGGAETVEYHLDWHNQFPSYELTIKTQKTYNTFIGHLYGDQIGEYKKLHDWCWHESQASVRKALGWDNTSYRDCFHRGIKTRWASACKELRNTPIHSLSEEWGADEFEAAIERKYHLYNKKKYGYS